MKYDVAIIGGGPAGLTAGIFTCRAGLKTVCFEMLAVGGQAALSYDIANYPGFENISGFDLMDKFYNHAKNLGLEFVYEGVKKIQKTKTGFSVKIKDKSFFAKKIIIATGCKPKRLNLENEINLIGKGISYCASCDGGFFKNKNVAVVGGGDSAVEYVKYLSHIAKKVTLINRSDKFRAQPYYLDEINKFKNVEILTGATVEKVEGESRLEKILINNNGKKQNVFVEGLFVAIGHEPNIPEFNFKINLDKNGYIIVDDNQKTNIENVYACGDIVSKAFKQIVTACADGARAGNACVRG